jgi:TfoX/Sxy family transcriptional regulator of competence genes
MSANKDFAEFLRGQFDGLEGLSIKPMMGGNVIHYLGRVLGFAFDDRILLEDGPTAQRILKNCPREPLFPGSKDFVIFTDYQNSRLLQQLAVALYDDLPISKPRKSDRAVRNSKTCKPSSGKSKSISAVDKTSVHKAPLDPDISSFLDFHRKGGGK